MKLSEIYESQFLTDHDEIRAWLDKINVKNYTIKSDGTVDVNGNVDIVGESLTSIPVQFGIVTGYFDCSYHELTSLAGCPSSAGDYFNCDGNEFTSLEGIADQIKKIEGEFICGDNKIESHVLGLMLIEGITKIICYDKWAEILNECLREGKDIYEAQTMLVEAELEEYAQL